MTTATHSQLADFIWSICNLLRGPYKRNEYRKVILPLTVLRRFDCLLQPTKSLVLEQYAAIESRPESVVRSLLEKITGYPFYNLSKLDFETLLNASDELAPNLNAYGATIATIGSDDVRSLTCPLPPVREQEHITDFLDRETARIDRMIDNVEAAIERLREYRSALITAAVTGKIDVRGIAA